MTARSAEETARRFRDARDLAVTEQLEKKGIKDARVIAACRAVPREEFIPDELKENAYEDGPQSIGLGQTISQLHIVAVMAEELRLREGDRVLEIGTGSGYAAAILSLLAREVHTVERLGPLATTAKERLAALGYDNVFVHVGDGTSGWPAHAPYEAILVSACGPRPPMALLEQLAVGGRLIMPIGEIDGRQALYRISRKSKILYEEEQLMGVRFVPLIGREGFSPDRSQRR